MQTDSRRQPRSLRSLFYSLRRHTSTGLYIPELDGLRFAAIAAVYFYHISGDIVRHNPPGITTPSSFLYLLTTQLNIGVPLFFAISGMILGLPFAKYWLQGGPKISLKRYFLRRLTRLEPPYVLSLLLLFALKYVSHRGGIREMLPHLGASLVYLHTLIYSDMSSINPVAWSLEVEVQFYVLAPVLALVFAVRTAWLRRAIVAGVIALAAIAFPWTDMTESRNHYLTWMTHLTLAGNIQYFLAGFLLAELFLLMPTARYRTRRWDVVTAVGWPALAVLLVESPQVAFIALPWIILVLYVAAFYGTASSGIFGSIWIASIGGMCYSIYLLHNYAIAALGFVTERVGQTLPFELRLVIQTLIMTPVILGICIVYYRLIEQPCMRSDWPMRLKDFALRRMGRVPKRASA